MELDEMKTAWKELDERLGRQEMFSVNFIKDSIAVRSQRSANKFLAGELIGAGLILLVIPFVMWVLQSAWAPAATRSFLTALLPLLPLILAWQLLKTFTLFRIDMSGGMLKNARAVKRYELYVLGEKRVSYFFVPLMVIGMTIVYAALRAPLWVWVFMIGLAISALLYCVWYYKKFYTRNMSALKRGIEELKDL